MPSNTTAYLIIDLEVIPGDGPAVERIVKVGALRTDTNQSIERVTSSDTLHSSLKSIDAMASGAQGLLGHNLILFDLPLLREVAPRLSFLRIPVIDTLLLSPLAFPQNPYHRLIKDYKLISDSLNSPLSDCRATWVLFQDQMQAFALLAKEHPQELESYHCLLSIGMQSVVQESAESNVPIQSNDQSMNTNGSIRLLESVDKPQTDKPILLRGTLEYNHNHVDISNTVADADGLFFLSAIDHLFTTFTGKPAPRISKVKKQFKNILVETDPALQRKMKVCSSALEQLIDQHISPQRAIALAYTLAWLRVSGSNSVLPPWVRHQFPQVSSLIESLRDIPCGNEHCSFCSTTHDPRHELQRYFGFDDFRYETSGESAQHDVVLAGMRGTSVLTVLATGGGKSVCYQLPALNRFHRNASLTVIISPLQSLMKDQVDGLVALNISAAAALNGLLTLPERADVLDRIQMGDVGILLVSPEQFRNRGFRRAIAQRHVGGWVFDEAHCLSKWGNDFRPDYLYAARYIRQYTGNKRLAPVSCFTATAKLDVLDDIREHFKEHLGITFTEFIGTPERPNLQFEVQPVSSGDKPAAIESLLDKHLSGTTGGAVVFVASRSKAEEFSEYLESCQWACAYYHAGLQPNEKKDIQDNFKSGELRVITATNAFGMGVDKQDVRLVAHADIPGSLENYLQEAGRAGRDQDEARCVLLYDENDIENQFNLSERSRLHQRDIQEILKKLKIEAKRRKGDSLIITAGEILIDDKTRTSFDADERDAQTKVITAIAWLERNEFIQREENRTTLYPARLTLDLKSALQRLESARLPAHRLQSYRSTLQFLYSANSDERINTDTLIQITGMGTDVVASMLKQMEKLGVLKNDTQITLYLRHGVVSTSMERLKQSLALEKAMFDLLPELAPDADHGNWVDLNLPALTTALRDYLDVESLLSLHVSRLLMSLSQDREGENRQRSPLELRHLNRDYLKIRLRDGRTWGQLRKLGERRRAVAAALLPFLAGKIRHGIVGKDVLVDTTFGELNTLLDRDIDLCTMIKPDQRERAIQHVLLYLHQQEVVTLNHGMSVMRSAMTIELNENMLEQRFTRKHYQKLDEHYKERRIQVHVMREYAQLGLNDMADALRLVLHYFSDTRVQFNRRYFRGRAEVLKLATSEASWQAIVMDLNDTQRALVTDNSDTNQLILAGPGSGKTRVIVHRVAYLLRVRRVPVSSVIVLTFNRHAANEIRTRLASLVDRDAWGLTVLTYHAMAMRLTGTSFVDRADTVSESELDSTIIKAAELLEGKLQVEGEDDVRDQLLQGYRHVLIDEYQDINEQQYRLVRALTHHQDVLDRNLNIIAVGDDDQNIYEWRGGSNQHIERFQQEYAARICYLIENYRSTEAIIDCANHLISDNTDRLKVDNPVRRNNIRSSESAGGVWNELDKHRRGRVLRLELPKSDVNQGIIQAQAVMLEMQRLRHLQNRIDLEDCAVLARQHHMLQPLQAYCEQHKVAYHLAADRNNALPITRTREFCLVIKSLRECASDQQIEAVTGSVQLTRALQRLSDVPTDNAVGMSADRQLDMSADMSIDVARVSYVSPMNPQWSLFFQQACQQLDAEFGDHTPGIATLIDWLYDYARTLRTKPPQGLYLGTVHASKGLEFEHVALLDGGWRLSSDSVEQERRLYYVGMTRAEQTLTLGNYKDHAGFADAVSAKVMSQEISMSPDPLLATRYQTVSLKDVDIGYAGSHRPDHSIHSAIATLQPGDILTLQRLQNRYQLFDVNGRVVGRMAASFSPAMTITQCTVAGIVVRYRKDAGKDPQFTARLKCSQWEVVVPALVGT